MSMSNAERRQVENELIFRRQNEKMGASLESLDAMHVEDGNEHLLSDDDLTLRFKCECSDEDCTRRVPLRLSRYQELHANRKVFIMLPGHQVDAIETVLHEYPDFTVVLKKHLTPESSGSLNQTSVHNT